MVESQNKDCLNESQALLDEIRRTEKEIAESVGAIRERLSSEHLKWKALYKVIFTVMVRLERTGSFIARHPVPTLLAGSVLAWLSLRKRQSSCRGGSASRIQDSL